MNSQKPYVTNYLVDTQQNTQRIFIKQNHTRTNPHLLLPFTDYADPYSMQQTVNRSQFRLKNMQLKLEKMNKLMKMVSDRVGLDSSGFLQDREEKWNDFQNKGRQDSIQMNSLSRGKVSEDQKTQILKKYNQASKHGMSLSRFCTENNLPERTVRRWITKR